MKRVFSVGRAHRWRCLFLVLVVIVFLRLAYTRLTTVKLPEHWYRRVGPEKNSAFIYWVHDLVVKDYLSKREKWVTSNLGTLLFKDQRKITKEAYLQNGHYTVLILKSGPYLESRHIYNYGTKRVDPLERCSVQNCDFTYEDSAVDTADAVVVYLHSDKAPNVTHQGPRRPGQRWIFLTDEAPENTFRAFFTSNVWIQYADVFNWSMSYRTDSDIPVPYGRVVPLQSAAPPGQLTDEGLASLVPHWHAKRRDALVAILISNCSSRRMKFVKRLMQYMTVHVYGKCSSDAPNTCPGYIRSDCPDINRYYFYLSLESSYCFQYMTEKIFYNAYSKGAIPVILGPDNESVKESLPPYSYIYAENYDNAEIIANVLINLGNNEQEMLAYHSWRHHFEVLNEHGYFKTRSVHYCRVCEALNYNDRAVSVYDNERLERFLNRESLCRNVLIPDLA